MSAYEHLKINQLVSGGLYQRFRLFMRGTPDAIKKSELKQFKDEYLRKHKILIAAIEKAETKLN